MKLEELVEREYHYERYVDQPTFGPYKFSLEGAQEVARLILNEGMTEEQAIEQVTGYARRIWIEMKRNA